VLGFEAPAGVVPAVGRSTGIIGSTRASSSRRGAWGGILAPGTGDLPHEGEPTGRHIGALAPGGLPVHPERGLDGLSGR